MVSRDAYLSRLPVPCSRGTAVEGSARAGRRPLERGRSSRLRHPSEQTPGLIEPEPDDPVASRSGTAGSDHDDCATCASAGRSCRRRRRRSRMRAVDADQNTRGRRARRECDGDWTRRHSHVLSRRGCLGRSTVAVVPAIPGHVPARRRLGPAARCGRRWTSRAGRGLREGGVMLGGRTLVQLRPGAATLAMRPEGMVNVAVWAPRSRGQGYDSLRQNLDLIVESGRPVPSWRPTAIASGASARATTSSCGVPAWA